MRVFCKATIRLYARISFSFLSFVVYACTSVLLGFFVLHLSKVFRIKHRRRKNVTSFSFRLLLPLLLFRQNEKVIELFERTSVIQSRIRNQQTTFSFSLHTYPFFFSLDNNINQNEDNIVERTMSCDKNKKIKRIFSLNVIVTTILFFLSTNNFVFANQLKKH